MVGLQECQNAQGIADKSGYKLLAPSNGNTVLYNSDLLQAIANGEFNIPRDVSSSNDLIVSFLIDNTTESNVLSSYAYSSRIMLNVLLHGESFVSFKGKIPGKSFCTSTPIFPTIIMKPQIEIHIPLLQTCYLIRGTSLVREPQLLLVTAIRLHHPVQARVPLKVI